MTELHTQQEVQEELNQLLTICEPEIKAINKTFIQVTNKKDNYLPTLWIETLYEKSEHKTFYPAYIKSEQGKAWITIIIKEKTR